VLGTVTFVLGHAVAFFFHVLWPAGIALLGVSGSSWGISISSGANVLLQTVSLLFLLGAWIFFLQKLRERRITMGRVGLGAVLSIISLFVVYQWSQTVIPYLGAM
jgi:hypothetical protein